MQAITFSPLLQDLLAHEGDVSGQLTTLSRCADYSQSIGAGHAHLLATLAKGAVLLTNHNYSVSRREHPVNYLLIPGVDCRRRGLS